MRYGNNMKSSSLYVAGNKGGVAARMKIKSTRICFVCAHLAAGQSNVQDRIDDYHDITNGVNFGKGTAMLDYIMLCSVKLAVEDNLFYVSICYLLS